MYKQGKLMSLSHVVLLVICQPHFFHVLDCKEGFYVPYQHRSFYNTDAESCGKISNTCLNTASISTVIGVE